MKPIFITPSVYHVFDDNGKRFENAPINISISEEIRKADSLRFNLAKGLYFIHFNFSGSRRTWSYETENDRDLEYNLIIERFKK